MTDDKVEVLHQVAILLHDKDFVLAEKILNEKYPFIPIKSIKIGMDYQKYLSKS